MKIVENRELQGMIQCDDEAAQLPEAESPLFFFLENLIEITKLNAFDSSFGCGFSLLTLGSIRYNACLLICRRK
jgi:hypothetical protein